MKNSESNQRKKYIKKRKKNLSIDLNVNRTIMKVGKRVNVLLTLHEFKGNSNQFLFL